MNKKPEHWNQSAPTGKDHPSLRLAIAATILGMTMGIGMGDVLAAPGQNEPAKPIVSKPTVNKQSVKKPAAVSDKAKKKPAATSLKLSDKPAATSLKVEKSR